MRKVIKNSHVSAILAIVVVASSFSMILFASALLQPNGEAPRGTGDTFLPPVPPDIPKSAPPVVDYTRFGTDYTGMVTKLTSLATLFPNYAELLDLNTLYGIAGIPKTGGGTYTLYALRMTNETSGLHKPEVLLQGGIHGDEFTTPTGLIWFCDWFLRYAVGYSGRVPADPNYNGFESDYFKWLLNNREIYVIPAYNPDGIVRNVRNDQTGRDMNRNFDWNVETSPSMATRNAQVLREFMNHHQFRVGYGGHDGSHFICYPMDSAFSGVTGRTIANTVSLPSRAGTSQGFAPPDYYFFDEFLANMINYTGTTPGGYFGSGGSYQGNFCPGGHWYPALGCQDTFMYASQASHSASYVENDGAYPGAGILWFTCEYSTTKNTAASQFGDDSSATSACWVATIKRQMLYLIDMAQPYVKFDKVTTPANNSKIQIGSQITLKWQVNGSLTCDQTRVQWGTNTNPRTTYTYTTPTNSTYAGKWIGGTGWSGSLNGATTGGKWFTQTITMPTTPGHYYFVARAKTDQTYGTSMGNLTGESYTENTYMRLIKERAKPGWSEAITGTDGSETMSYQDYWYSDVIHIQVIADPVINITAPVQNADVYGSSFPVWINASDLDSMITAVQVQVNGGSWTAATFQSGTLWRANINFNVYAEGSTVNITARCTNDDLPAVTKYTSRFATVNNYLRPTVFITGLTNGTTRNAGSSLPVSWIVNGSRVFSISKTQLYWTNGTRMPWPTRPLDSYGGTPITFATAGSQGYFFSTANTFGAGAGDDGFDWSRNLGYVATSTGVMTTFHDPDGQSGAVPHSQNPHSIEVEIGGLTTNTIDSGAYGIQFYVDAGLGLRSVTVSFKWWAYDRIGVLGLTDETEKPMYLKTRFGSSGGGMTYLQGSGAQGGDPAADIVCFTSPDGGGPLSYSGTETINVTTLVTGSGWYYLELGAAFDARGTGQTAGEGICAFYDDIDVAVSRYKIVTDPFVAGHTNRWNSVALSGSPGTYSDTITLPNLPGQTVYIAANASSDGQTEEGRSLIWSINLIAGGVTISNMIVLPPSGGTGTTFTIRANIASINPISQVRAYIEAPDETPIATITLSSLGNGTYTGTWNSVGQTRRTYYIDYYANNTLGESQSINNGVTFVIVNTPPSIAAATISPGTAYEATTLTATASGWSDADGDAAGYTYRWFKNNAIIPGQTGSTLTGSNFNKNDNITVEITPYDGYASGNSRNSSAVTILNSAPSITNASISPGTAYEATTLTATANGWSDADGDAAGYTYRWFRNNTIISGQTGSMLTGSNFNKDDNIVVEVTPFDGTSSGTPRNSSAVTILNSAPSITIASISPGTAYEATTLTATANGWSDADGDTAGYRYRWFNDGALIAGQTTSTLTGASFSKNNAIIAEITPYDGYASGNSRNSSAVTILNSAPSITSASISPGTAYEATTLTATANGWSDADGDAAGYTYRWFRNNTIIPGQTGSTLTGSNFNKSDNIVVEVMPFDGTSSGTPRNSSAVTILNSAPSITIASISPGTAYEATTLTATASGWSDADGDTAGYRYRWFNDGALIAGQTTSTLTGASFSKNNAIIAEITPFDGTASGTPVNASSVTILNTPPVETASIAPDSTIDQTPSITWSACTDVDGDPVSYYIRIGTSSGSGDFLGWIACASAEYLVLTSMNQDTNYYVQVIATDSSSNSSTHEETVFIVASNSAPTAPTTISPESTQDVTPLITWSGATDPDVGQQVYYFIHIGTMSGSGDVLPWMYCSSESYQVLTTLAVRIYFVEVKSYDGLLNSSTTLIRAVEVLNSPPSISGVLITPAAPITSDDLTASATGASDINGDSISFTYRWFLNGTNLGVTTNTLSEAEFDKWDVITCEITPYDSTTGTPVNGSVTILNAPPSIASAGITPLLANKTSVLTATPTGWADVDFDTPRYYYQWYVNGAPVNVPDNTLAPSHFNKGNSVYCIVTPSDGQANGTSVPSNTIVITNSQPSISSVSITPDPAYADDALSATPSGASDADGDTVSYSYKWWVAGTVVSGQTGSSLSGSFLTKNVTVTCQVTPFDGTANGTALNGTITIQNSAPSIASATISPGTAYEATTLIATASGWNDVDGDSAQYTYRWFNTDALIAGQTTSTLTGASFSKGNEIIVEITPFDGTASGTPTNSSNITILNSAPLPPTTLNPRQTTDLTPLVSWTEQADLDGDVLQHYTRIVNATNPVQVIVGWQLLGAPFYQVLTPLSLNQSYIVQVVSWDGSLNSTLFQDYLNTTNTVPFWTSPGNYILPDITTNPRPTITWVPATDPDGQVVTYSIIINSSLTGFNVTTWYSTGTTTSLALVIDLSVGNFTIQIQAYDSLEYSTYLLEPLEIVNTAPTFSSVSLDTAVAWENSTIMALPTGFSDANTEDEGFWVYEWLVNGSMVLNGTTINLSEAITISGTNFNKHDRVSCNVRAIDNHGGVSAPITSTAITISNSMPVIVDLAIAKLGTQYLQNETLYGQANAFDADGDVVQYTFLWYIAPGGVNFTYAYTGSSLFDPSRTYFQTYDSIIICAIPFDGEAIGTPVNSSMIEIQNSKPGICTAAWLDTTAGAFVIPIVRWQPAFDYDGGFQTYEIYIGSKPYIADLLEMSRASSPYTALCYRYISNQSICNGTIYVHIRAIDEFQLPSDEVLIFNCTWSPTEEELETTLTREVMLIILGLSTFAIIGGFALAFSLIKRVEHSIDIEIPSPAKKLPTKKGKKETGKPSSSYTEIPLPSSQSAPAPTVPSNPPPASIPAAAPVADYRDVLKERMGRVKNAINSKDYTNALAWLQEMIVIAEKNGELDLAGNYKKKFEEILQLSVD